MDRHYDLLFMQQARELIHEWSHSILELRNQSPGQNATCEEMYPILTFQGAYVCQAMFFVMSAQMLEGSQHSFNGFPVTEPGGSKPKSAASHISCSWDVSQENSC